LLAFAAGFLVRPFGALVFGRLGDMIGRKYTFVVTIVIMGAETFIVGLLPNYATIGITAPIKIGRESIIMAGCLLGAVSYFTVFPMSLQYANPALKKAHDTVTVSVTADPATRSFQGSTIARDIDFTSSCDRAKRVLAQEFVLYKNIAGPAGSNATVQIGTTTIASLSPTLNEKRNAFSVESSKGIADFKKAVPDSAKANGLTEKAEDKSMKKLMIGALLVYLVNLVTMVYGPIAAILLEMFPTRIRYTSMSSPYRICNGWFGGLLPTTAFAMVAATGDIYYGLWYPVIVAAGAFVIGMLLVKETRDIDIYANVQARLRSFTRLAHGKSGNLRTGSCRYGLGPFNLLL